MQHKPGSHINPYFDDVPAFHLSIVGYDAMNPEIALGLATEASAVVVEPYMRRPGYQAGWSWIANGRRHGGRKAKGTTINLRPANRIAGLGAIQVGMTSPRGRNPVWNYATSQVAISLIPLFGNTSYEVSVRTEILMGPATPRGVEEFFVVHAKQAFDRLGGVVGYITNDWVLAQIGGGWPPYEHMLGLSSTMAAVNPHNGERLFHTHTRGYYWGNFLNPIHVDILGGEAALGRAPVALVERLQRGWYLQLTDDANDVPIERLRELRDFLAPVLPTRYYDSPRPPDWMEQLPPLRL